MENTIFEIAERIRGLREILEISVEEMAEVCGVSVEEYVRIETGKSDFTFSFLCRCAERFGVDTVEIITGDKPKLTFYTIVRKGKGLPIKRREGFVYQHLAPNMKNKTSDPLFVTVPYVEEEQNQPIALSRHDGQEFDYVIEGTLKMDMEGHIEILHEGDSIYYDSAHGHGMVAMEGKPCKFLAIVFKPQEKAEKEEL